MRPAFASGEGARFGSTDCYFVGRDNGLSNKEKGTVIKEED